MLVSNHPQTYPCNYIIFLIDDSSRTIPFQLIQCFRHQWLRGIVGAVRAAPNVETWRVCGQVMAPWPCLNLVSLFGGLWQAQNGSAFGRREG